MLFGYFQKGGIIMVFILLASVIGLAIFIERLFFLIKAGKDADSILESIQAKAVKTLRTEDAIAICNNNPGPAANIFKVGLEVSVRPREEMERAIEEASKQELPKLSKNIQLLSAIASISTLLGLLGTVLGLISSTDVLSAQGLSSPVKVIGGISSALITTAFGLIVAIPAIAGYHYIATKVEDLISHLESKASELVRIVKRDLDIKKW